MAVVEVAGLHKSYRIVQHRSGRLAMWRDFVSPGYRTIEALNDFNLEIASGEIVGIVGPNGAGKSTLLKSILGILVPTSGSIRTLGVQPHDHRRQLASRVGVHFGQRTQLWWDLPVLDSLRLHQVIYRLPEAEFQGTLAMLDRVLGLADLYGQSVRQLSLGQRGRADLALTLLHRPDLVLLDEPSIGLDVLARDRVRSFLREVNRELGTTILLTSHDMGDIEELCERVVIVSDGSKLFDGSLDDLRARYIRDREVSVVLAHPVVPPDWPDVSVVVDEPTKLRIVFQPSVVPVADLMRRLVSELPVADLSLSEPGVESVIRLLRLGEERRGVAR